MKIFAQVIREGHKAARLQRELNLRMQGRTEKKMRESENHNDLASALMPFPGS
jgi:hypothetical protein